MIDESVWIRIIKDYSELEISLIKRDIRYEIPRVQRALSIIGSRRSGKTYLMFQITRDIDMDRTLYVNFEDPRLVGIENRDLMKMLDIYYSIYPENAKKTCFFFLDELQNIHGWERFVRYLLDRNQKVVLSGSSSKLLSKEIATELRGRTITIKVYPFTFREILVANKLETTDYLSTYEEAKIKNLSRGYLEWGGYPEVILNPSLRREILREILNLTIYRDIVERWKILNLKVLRLIMKMLAYSPHLSISKIYNNLKGLGVGVGKTTVANYLEYLEESMVFHKLYIYMKSYKKQELLGFKSYLVDNGLLKIQGVEDKSRLLENLVFTELLKKGYEPNNSIFYYKTRDNKEIDFLLKDGNKLNLLEVTYDLDNEHISRLFDAMGELKIKKGIIVTWDTMDIIRKGNMEVNVIPLWRWLITK